MHGVLSAWRIVYEQQQAKDGPSLELVSLLPSFMLGPPSTAKPSFNVDFIDAWLQGRPIYESRLLVDVRYMDELATLCTRVSAKGDSSIGPT